MYWAFGNVTNTRFAQALGPIAGHHHLAPGRQALRTGHPEELLTDLVIRIQATDIPDAS